MVPVCPGYGIKERLGEGGFGTVYAIKVVKLSPGMSNLDLLEEEIYALSQLSHPNIVSFIEVVEHKSVKHIVMEYCGRGDLRKFLNFHLELCATVPESRIKSIFVQLLLALHHCHHSFFGEWSLLHRDIKPENVLFSENGTVKLGDFGLSKILEASQQQAISFVGTPGYLAPEVFAGKRYGAKADMFSLGCLLYEMCALDAPIFSGKDNKQPIQDRIPDTFSPEVKSLAGSLLQHEPSKRPSSADLLSRRYVAEWLREISSRPTPECSIDHREVLQALTVREQRLSERERSLKARERAFEAKEASLEAQMRRLALRASLSPPPEDKTRRKQKSASPAQR
ncbi:G2-specific serine/threonine protein kinase [Saitozyma podzolica]|uniref:non-specific serine/threonine protein kinase n=1 Tax=Saitozyma podzolica TaxID=1890683 RepID=A0A427XPE4_9TREE|nr:G2-specific serine/threonine protein kinase [Saitozyma podzolica]